ncbi:MAG: hypothetical protein KAS72_11315 [Phycisphaerales bacterium]|nr:hypothetical protein [Phycisphaerales bacterium]
MRHTRVMNRIVTALLAVVLVTLMGPQHVTAIDDEVSDEAVAMTVDKLYYRDGTVIVGQIISETDTEIVIEVIVGDIPPQERTFSREGLIYIEYDVPYEGDKDPTEEERRRDEVDPDSVGVTVISLKGKFGFHISQTPLREAMEAVEKTDAQYVILKLNCFEGNVFSLGDIFKVLQEYIYDEWKDDGPDVVIWVEFAFQGAGLLPFVDEDVYFKSDGIMGGVTRFDDDIREAPADDMIKEKWISATMGQVEGVCIQGGYDTRLVKAMIKESFELSVDFVGGQPIYHEDLTGKYVLTDNGEGEYEDTISEGGQTVRFQNQNDVLNLNAEMAYRLRVSDGTADTLDELMSLLHVRKWHEIDGKPQRIILKWSDGIERARAQIRSGWEQIQRMRGSVNGDYRERTRKRGAILNELKKVERLVRRYQEVLDPGGRFLINIELTRHEIKEQQKRDNENR